MMVSLGVTAGFKHWLVIDAISIFLLMVAPTFVFEPDVAELEDLEVAYEADALKKAPKPTLPPVWLLCDFELADMYSLDDAQREVNDVVLACAWREIR